MNELSVSQLQGTGRIFSCFALDYALGMMNNTRSVGPHRLKRCLSYMQIGST